MKSKTLEGLFRLDGKNAIVTGGAGLLGRKFSRALALQGANVAVVDLLEEQAEAVAAEIQGETNTKCFGIKCDVSDPRSVSQMMERVSKEFENVHILLNNAATKSSDLDAFFAPFETFSLSTWKEIMSVNIDGMFVVAQAVIRNMLAHGQGGSIIQTSSIYGILAPDSRIYEGSEYQGRAINSPAVYSVSKAAVVGLSQYLAAYLGQKKIRVNTLTPGGVESGQNNEFKKRYSDRIPMGRMAKADELIGALVYLASEASSYVTGQNIVVDGGLSVW